MNKAQAKVNTAQSTFNTCQANLNKVQGSYDSAKSAATDSKNALSNANYNLSVKKTDWHEHSRSKQSAGAAEHGNGGTDRCKHSIDQRNQ